MSFIKNLEFKSLSIAFLLYIFSFLLFNFFTNFSYGNHYWQIIIPQILAFFPFFLFYMSDPEVGQSLLSLKKIPLLSLMWISVLVFILIFPLQILTTVVNSLFPGYDKDVILLTKGMKEVVLSNGLVGSIFLFALIPALFEEFVFRGFLLGLLRKSGLGNIFSVIIVALMFSFLHLSYLNYLPAFISGLLIGYLVVTMRSLYGAIFYHLLHNVIIVSFIFYGSQTDKLNLELIKANLFQFSLLLILLLGVGFWVLRVKIALVQKKNCL